MCSRPVDLMRVFSPLPMIFSSVRGSFTGIVRLMRLVSCAFLPLPLRSSASVRVNTAPTAWARNRSISSTKTSTDGSPRGRGGLPGEAARQWLGQRRQDEEIGVRDLGQDAEGAVVLAQLGASFEVDVAARAT